MTLATDSSSQDREFSSFRPRRWLQQRIAQRLERPHVLALLEPEIAPVISTSETLDHLGDFGLHIGYSQQPIAAIQDSLQVSPNLSLKKPETIPYGSNQLVLASGLVSDDLLNRWSPIEVSSNLCDALIAGNTDGTLFFKANLERDGSHRQARVVTPSQRSTARGQRSAHSPNIFELLLPILIPPASAGVSGELLIPEGQALYEFQNYGVKWLSENETALLADDMGTGKTVQAIIAFRLLLQQGKALNALVVSPKSVVTSWRRHVETWAPELQSVVIEGTPQERSIQWGIANRKVHVVVTNYETLVRDRERLKPDFFDVVIADEVQRVKNSSIQASQVLRRFLPKYRWGLTGTPLENRTEDIVGIFQFVRPGLFRATEIPSARQARDRIAPFMLRRRKTDVLKELPEKIRDVRYVQLGEKQRIVYDQLERTGRMELERQNDATVQNVLALITRLKQVCNYEPISHESVKLEWLQDHVSSIADEGSKALVFSQFVQTLEFVKPRLSEHGVDIYKGQLSSTARDAVIERFKSDPSTRVLLVSLRAGGTGLTLTEANYVVHFDSWWNPATMAQAEDRTHRIGQDKTVFVTTLVAENTIEERIQKLLDEKRHLFEQVIDDLSDSGLSKVLSEEALFGLFGLRPPRQRMVESAEQASQGQKTQIVPRTQEEAKVFRPSEPFSNIVRLQTILRECEGYIWWSDPHFGTRALVELVSVVDPSKLSEIRILSRADQFSERTSKEFNRFREEMNNKGIRAEWRVTNKSVSHDRYIISENVVYNVPPVNSIFQGSYGEGLVTSARPPFEEWWSQADVTAE